MSSDNRPYIHHLLCCVFCECFIRQYTVVHRLVIGGEDDGRLLKLPRIRPTVLYHKPCLFLHTPTSVIYLFVFLEERKEPFRVTSPFLDPVKPEAETVWLEIERQKMARCFKLIISAGK